MTTAINKTKLNNLANEIWKSAERLRGKFKAYEYQSVILPIIVIRRLECVLIEWRIAIQCLQNTACHLHYVVAFGSAIPA